jgi:hypothetical protein
VHGSAERRHLPRAQRRHPRGSDANFAPAADIVEKFEKLAVHALPKKRIGELRDAVLRLEEFADPAELAALLVKP